MMKPGQWRFIKAELRRLGFQCNGVSNGVLHAYYSPLETGAPVVTVSSDYMLLHFNFRFRGHECSPHVEAFLPTLKRASYRTDLAELVKLYDVMKDHTARDVRIALEHETAAPSGCRCEGMDLRNEP